MVRKKAEQKVSANLTSQEMEGAIPKIERRIDELKKFDVASVDERSDPRIGTLSSKLETLLATVFGANTIEYDRYNWSVTHLDRASINMMHATAIQEVREGLIRGIEGARSQLEAIVEGFREELEDRGISTSSRTLKAYEGLELHPYIEKAAGQLFKDGHYANAIENAVKALNNIVRLNSGIEDRDGSNLMETVFNPKNPVLAFNNLNDQSNRDEQKGFMMLFSGAVSGLRNPRAHKIIEDDPEKALEFIAFISLLSKLSDSATRRE
ncbi:MAG: TIGR02391 family protein [Rhodobacteraceae bacterium]|nr:TIGR02391 family protein [Paracoccaceae bacterium]